MKNTEILIDEEFGKQISHMLKSTFFSYIKNIVCSSANVRIMLRDRFRSPVYNANVKHLVIVCKQCIVGNYGLQNAFFVIINLQTSSNKPGGQIIIDIPLLSIYHICNMMNMVFYDLNTNYINATQLIEMQKKIE